MRKLIIEIEDTGAAMEDAPEHEVREMLRQVHIQAFGCEYTEGKIKDSNGNTVGRWLWSTSNVDHQAAVTACRAVFEWARTPGDHGGNPYCKPFVRLAMQAIGELDGQA